ncbi:MAG: hypothetical protein NWE89_01175 [Candidatus Bathyarchaeota archaeon]|nr:hypothetical protein [Candidatus Bathyarchaeota archaeon]
MSASEKVIKETSSDWVVYLDNSAINGSMTLTDTRIIFGSSDQDIFLNNIKNIEILTRLADTPQISIENNNWYKTISFERKTGAHLANVLFGNTGWVHGDIASYTSYWASLFTFARFLHGNPPSLKRSHEESVSEVWCYNCDSYVQVKKTRQKIWTVECPVCNSKSLLSNKPR